MTGRAPRPGVWFSRWGPEQRQQVEIGARQVNLVQHIGWIISLDASRSNCRKADFL
jgi:hypothetical protein